MDDEEAIPESAQEKGDCPGPLPNPDARAIDDAGEMLESEQEKGGSPDASPNPDAFAIADDDGEKVENGKSKDDDDDNGDKMSVMSFAMKVGGSIEARVSTGDFLALL